MKLSALEKTALEAMTKARVGEKFMPKTVLGLVRKGLATREFSAVGWRNRFAITEAGRQAMKEYGK